MPCLIPITAHTEALSWRTMGSLSLRAKIWASLWQRERKLMTSPPGALPVTSMFLVQGRLNPNTKSEPFADES